MAQYDFILFENYSLATHHLFDVELIARMLDNEGYKVAIFDLYHMYKVNEVNGIPIIHWSSKCPYPDDAWMKTSHSKITSLKKVFSYKRRLKNYLKEAKTFIQGKADNFYCGSIYNGMPCTLFDIQKPCYWWGLRSERLKLSWGKILRKPLISLGILSMRKAFLQNPLQRLFVSNQIILDEHAALGIPRHRIIVREERCVDSIGNPNLDKRSKNVSFLVIGMLRPEKNVTTTIEAYKKANIPDSTLCLTGRSTLGYEGAIEQGIDGDARIQRNNNFLEYSDFNAAFRQSHFVLFADEKGPSCITNGTMVEALINHRPVICPDYNPYKYYVEKFGIGLLYDKNSPESYSSALKQATKLGTEYFQPAIDEFLRTIRFDFVSHKLVADIKRTMTS